MVYRSLTTSKQEDYQALCPSHLRRSQCVFMLQDFLAVPLWSSFQKGEYGSVIIGKHRRSRATTLDSSERSSVQLETVIQMI